MIEKLDGMDITMIVLIASIGLAGMLGIGARAVTKKHESQVQIAQLQHDARIDHLEIEKKILQEQVRQLAAVAPSNFTCEIELSGIIEKK